MYEVKKFEINTTTGKTIEAHLQYDKPVRFFMDGEEKKNMRIMDYPTSDIVFSLLHSNLDAEIIKDTSNPMSENFIVFMKGKSGIMRPVAQVQEILIIDLSGAVVEFHPIDDENEKHSMTNLGYITTVNYVNEQQ